MRTLSKHLFAALLGTALISSCSRPVAYFQPTAREQFKTTQSAAPVSTAAEESAVAATVSAEAVQPVAVETPQATPAQQVAQTKQTVSQIEAYVRNDNKLASNKKLTKRLARVNELLTSASANATILTNAATAKKMTFMERTLLKKLDKKIKNHVAPDKTQAMNSNVRLGLIIGIIGLVLLIIGGGALSVIGAIGLVVGLVLILLGVINT